MTVRASNAWNSQKEREAQRAAAKRRRRSAYPAAIVILAATAPGLIFFSLVALRSSSGLYYGVAGASLFLALVAIASLVLIKGRRAEIGIWLLIGGTTVFVLASMLLVKGVATVAAVTIPLVIIEIAILGLPRRQILYAAITGLAAGGITLLLNALGAENRLSTPDAWLPAAVVASAVFLTLGFFTIKRLTARLVRVRLWLVGNLASIVGLLLLIAVVNYAIIVRLGHFLDRVEAEAAQTATSATVEQFDAIHTEADETRRAAQVVSVAVGLLTVVTSIGIAVVTAHSIARPAEQLTSMATRLAAGRFDEPVRIDRVDEFGRLASSLNEAANRLRAAHTQIEMRVADRTDSLARRTNQLEAAAQIAREASAIHDVDQLLNRTVRLIAERFGFAEVNIYLIDDTRKYTVLRAAASEEGQKLLAQGHKLRVDETSTVGHVAGLAQPRIASNVGAEAALFPDRPPIRSEMALPLKARNQVIGVLDVQSTATSAFSDADAAILQAMADQLALAIENARLLEETQRTLREIDAMYGRQARESWRERTAHRPAAYLYTRVGVEAVPPGRLAQQTAPPDQRQAAQGETGYQMTAPIRLRGQTIGSIVLRRDVDEGPWSQQEIALIEEVSTQIAPLALENARLLEETRKRAEQERIVANITASVRSSMDFETILQTAVRELGAALGADRAFVQLSAGTPPSERKEEQEAAQ